VPIAALEDFLPSIFGFLGVALGAVITYVIEAQRRDHDAQMELAREQWRQTREEEASARAAKGVARVWIEELRRYKRGVETAHASGRWNPPPDMRYFAEMTREDRLILADHLSKEAWDDVCFAHRNAQLMAGVYRSDPGVQVTAAGLDVQTAEEHLVDGILALRAFAEGATTVAPDEPDELVTADDESDG
jgi:hypothetical protein